MGCGKDSHKGARFANLCVRFNEYDATQIGVRCAFILGGTLSDLGRLIRQDENAHERTHYYRAMLALGLDESGHKLGNTPKESNE